MHTHSTMHNSVCAFLSCVTCYIPKPRACSADRHSMNHDQQLQYTTYVAETVTNFTNSRLLNQVQ